MGPTLTLLGGFSLVIDGREVGLNAGAARVLAALGLYAPNPVARPELGALLWPEKLRERALANLRGILWRLPDEAKMVVLDKGDGLALEGSVAVDTGRLSNAVDGVEPDVAALAAPLLPGWYDDWVLVERERVALAQMATLETRAQRLLASGEAAGAIEAALASIAIEPLRELPHRLVIRGHLAEGNIAEAIDHLERTSSYFAEEIGAALTIETTELVRLGAGVTRV